MEPTNKINVRPQALKKIHERKVSLTLLIIIFIYMLKIYNNNYNMVVMIIYMHIDNGLILRKSQPFTKDKELNDMNDHEQERLYGTIKINFLFCTNILTDAVGASIINVQRFSETNGHSSRFD